MYKHKFAVRIIVGLMIVSAFAGIGLAEVREPNVVYQNDAIKIWYEFQHDELAIDSNSAIAVHFETGDKWHFYADADTAPAPNLYLQVKAKNARGLEIGQIILPPAKDYFDKSQNKNVRVYGGDFTVYLPFRTTEKYVGSSIVPDFEVIGAYCSDFQCRILQNVGFMFYPIPQIAKQASPAKFELPIRLPADAKVKSSEAFKITLDAITLSKFGLAILVGLLFNVMPCVWPMIPLIIAKLLKQSQESKARSLGLGFSFCIGIIAFFAALAILNIVLKLGFGTVFQWGDYFRYPWFIKAMSLLLILLGLFMFGVFSIGIPSSVTSKAGSGQGFGGAFGMGFLAALLSTPCSFGVLAGVVAWAQTQSLLISTLVFLLMGIGMALPYAILISMPAMLKKIPKPGDWMERVKQAMGFVLLIIAVKLIESLSVDALIGTLYFAVVLGIAAWMWGNWVSYATPKNKKYTIRLIAVIITIAAGFYFLTSKQSLVDWQAYDSAAIEKAKEAGQPVLIKFDASWCATCKVVDVMVYQKSQIADLLKDKKVLTVKGDTTDYTLPASVDLKNVYNEPGVPVTVIWLPGEKEPIKLRGIISKKDVMDVLERIK